MYRRTEVLVAGAATFAPVHLAGLEADRGCASIALQGFRILEAASVVAAFTQEARSQFLSNAGQRAKQLGVRVCLEELCNANAIGLELLLQEAQLFGQGYRQPALGIRNGLIPTEASGVGENVQTFLIGVTDRVKTSQCPLPFRTRSVLAMQGNSRELNHPIANGCRAGSLGSAAV